MRRHEWLTRPSRFESGLLKDLPSVLTLLQAAHMGADERCSVVVASQGGWLWGETQTSNLTQSRPRATLGPLPSGSGGRRIVRASRVRALGRIKLEVCHG